MDALALALWAKEVTPEITGQEIWDSGTYGAWRGGFALSGGRWLTASIERFHPTVFLESRPGRPSGGFPAGLVNPILRKPILGIDSVPGERILRIRFESGSLVLELLPAQPALLLVDEEETILAVHRHARTPAPRLAAGGRYAAPDNPSGQLHPGLDRRLKDALGISADEPWASVVARAVGFGAPAVGAVGGRFIVSPVELAGAATIAKEPDINTAARAAFLLALRAERRAERERTFQARVRSLGARLRRLDAALERDLERAESWPKWEKFGTALLAHARALPKRASAVTLPDPFDPEGPEIRFPVDPRLSAAQNAAGYLKRAARGKRAIEIIAARRQRLSEDLAWIAAREERPESEWPHEETKALEALLDRYHIRIPATPRARPSPTAVGAKFHPRRYRSSDGWTILVGRSNAENDWLTHRHARPDDIWLHAQGAPGAHVILRREGRRDNPSRRTLEEAAAIAAAFSGARHSTTVPVIYTDCKYVRKPRKAAPGIAVCTREKTLMVRPANLDEARHADEKP